MREDGRYSSRPTQSLQSSDVSGAVPACPERAAIARSVGSSNSPQESATRRSAARCDHEDRETPVSELRPRTPGGFHQVADLDGMGPARGRLEDAHHRPIRFPSQHRDHVARNPSIEPPAAARSTHIDQAILIRIDCGKQGIAAGTPAEQPPEETRHAGRVRRPRIRPIRCTRTPSEDCIRRPCRSTGEAAQRPRCRPQHSGPRYPRARGNAMQPALDLSGARR